MPTILEKRMVFFHSQNENATYNQNPSYFSISLPPTIFQIQYPNTYYRVCMNQATIVNDFWYINSSNRNLKINGVLYQLTEGQPTLQEVVAELNSFGVDCWYDDTIARLVFRNDYTFDFSIMDNCAPELGFLNGQVYNMTAGQSPPNAVFFGEFSTIYVLSNINNNSFTLSQGQTINTNVMASISNLAGAGQYLNYYDNNYEFAIIERNNRNLQNIYFSLTDINFTPLTLNAYWTATITVEILIDYEDLILKSLETLNNTFSSYMENERRARLLESIEKEEEKHRKKKLGRKSPSASDNKK